VLHCPVDHTELVDHFVRKFCEQSGKHLTISPRTVQYLEDYAWHGNVRAIPLRRHREIVIEVGGYVPPHTFFLFSGQP